MRDHEPSSPGFEADDTTLASESELFVLDEESLRDLADPDEPRWSRSSTLRLGCLEDIHDRPTVIP